MIDSCICVDPDESAETISETVRKARKPHLCGECREVIEPGQRYEHHVGKYDGHIFIADTCETCVKVRSTYFKCGWYFGEIWAWMHDHFCNQEDDGFCMCPPKAPKTCWGR